MFDALIGQEIYMTYDEGNGKMEWFVGTLKEAKDGFVEIERNNGESKYISIPTIKMMKRYMPKNTPIEKM